MFNLSKEEYEEFRQTGAYQALINVYQFSKEIVEGANPNAFGDFYNVAQISVYETGKFLHGIENDNYDWSKYNVGFLNIFRCLVQIPEMVLANQYISDGIPADQREILKESVNIVNEFIVIQEEQLKELENEE